MRELRVAWEHKADDTNPVGPAKDVFRDEAEADTPASARVTSSRTRRPKAREMRPPRTKS